MRTTNRLLAAIAVAATIGFTACGGGSSGRETKRGGEETEEEESGTKGIPAPLSTIEAQAEDIIDIAPTNKWDKVGADVQDVAAAWDAYRARALRDGASQSLVERFDAALTALRASATARQPAEAMQRANDLSGATVELFGLYHTPTPVTVGRLDVIGRQIILDADRGDVAGAGEQVDRAQSTWDQGLKADILDHDGRAVARQTDAELAAMDRARDARDFGALRTQARAFLETVDAMEALY